MEELKKFRLANHLTQDALGAFLGVQKSFISKIENGYELLPEDKLRKLLQNENGWDTTILEELLMQHVIEETDRKIALTDLFSRPRKKPEFYQFQVTMPRKNSKDDIIETLRKQNAELQREISELKLRLEKAEMERQQFLEIIKRLTDK